MHPQKHLLGRKNISFVIVLVRTCKIILSRAKTWSGIPSFPIFRLTNRSVEESKLFGTIRHIFFSKIHRKRQFYKISIFQSFSNFKYPSRFFIVLPFTFTPTSFAHRGMRIFKVAILPLFCKIWTGHQTHRENLLLSPSETFLLPTQSEATNKFT